MDSINDNDPYLRGGDDFRFGIPRHMNPYDEEQYGTPAWEAWFEGWDDAAGGASYSID
jgi:hypothetical protein